MKLIKRVFGDLIGIIALPLCAIMQRGSFAEFAVDTFGIFFLPVTLLWFVIKSIWRVLTVWKDFKNPLAKIFTYFAIISSIAALAMTALLPDLLASTWKFMPIPITGFQNVLKSITDISMNHITSLGAGGVSVLAILGAIWWLFVGLLSLLLFSGASLIPAVAYIWFVLFIGAIWATITEILRGRDGAFYLTFYDWSTYDVTGVKSNVWSTLRFWLYLFPVVNVITYRIMLSKDKKDTHNYPPLDKNGKIDKDKIRHLRNSIYTKLIQ